MMRDMSFIFMALFFSVIVFIVFKKLNAILNSLKNTLHSTQEFVDSVTGPVTTGSGLAAGAAKIGGFLLGLSRRRQKKSKT